MTNKRTKTKKAAPTRTKKKPTMEEIVVRQFSPGQNQGLTHTRGTIMREVKSITLLERTMCVSVLREVPADVIQLCPRGPLAQLQSDVFGQDARRNITLDGDDPLPPDLKCAACGRCAVCGRS